MSVDEATFYQNKDYGGEAFPYQLGANVQLPGDLNDKFKSVRVGSRVKVLAWQHYGGTGQYREWEVDTPDITGIGGLSQFKVIESTTLSIAVRLQDDTGAEAGRFNLTVNSYEVGTVTTPSGNPEFALVGTMPADGPPVTTAIYVRDVPTGEYLASGAIYFVWNPETRAVDVADATNFPANMNYERASPNQFTFHLTSARAA